MTNPTEIARLRLRRQWIDPAPGPAPGPAEVVDRLCAMQAQDYAGALWSVGLRSAAGTTVADVERAIAERKIIRTWPMRGTLHFVAPADVGWMLALLAPRRIAANAKRYRDLGLDEKTFERAQQVFEDALSGGGSLTRPEAMAALERHGIGTEGQRGYHILGYLAQRGVLCLGPMQGRQQTFVLLDEWVPRTKTREPGPRQVLARLATRYFGAHGPATIADLAWWAGVTKTDARAAVDAAAGSLECLTAAGTEYWTPAGVADAGPKAGVHLLPGFDEYMLGYTDRSLQLGGLAQTYGSVVAANGMFAGTVIADGRIAGTWRRALNRDEVTVQVSEFRPFTATERRGVEKAAGRYGRYLGKVALVTRRSSAV